MISPQSNFPRVRWDIKNANHDTYVHFVRQRASDTVPKEVIQTGKEIWLEIGSGSGHFFGELAKQHPDKQFVGIERDRFRGNRLVKKSQRWSLEGIDNFSGIRGNAIAAVVRDFPDASVSRIYVLYPCPWPKNRHRKNRWYMHPLMSHMVRILKPGGLLIWASDQKFYIEEARYVSESVYGFETLAHDTVGKNGESFSKAFPSGRTKFESTFLAQGLPCFELVSQKKSAVNIIPQN